MLFGQVETPKIAAESGRVDWPTLISQLWPYILGLFATISTALGVAARAVWSWFKPRGDEILFAWRDFFKELKDQHMVLANATQTALIQANTIDSLERRYRHQRNEILVVDDDVFAIKLIDTAIAHAKNKSERFKYATVAHVGSLASMHTHLYNVIVVILDVLMPDSDEKNIQLFVRNFRGCPVILYTGNNDLTLEDFPGAFALVHKPPVDDLTVLSQQISLALDRCPATGCDG